MNTPSCNCDHEVSDLLDQAFTLLEQGDVDGAERLCEHASEHAPDHPEVSTLAGCIASDRGAFEDAVECFERAVRQDPSHVVALVDMAELQLESMGDPEASLASCDRGLAVVQDDPEARVELLTIRARALIDLEQPARALEALRATRGVEVADATVLERVGAAAIELEAWEIAEGALSAALRIDPDHADAHYGLGWVALESSDPEAGIAHWLRTLELDASAPRPPWHLSPEAFDRAAEQALLELPDAARKLLQQVAVVVEDLPAEEEVRDGLDPRLLGLFCGAPLPEQGTMDPTMHEPNVIKLYQRNLEGACSSREQLVDEIRTTLLHETAHFFGLEDDDLEQIGLG